MGYRGLEQADRDIGVERRGCRGIEARLLHLGDASERDSVADLEAGRERQWPRVLEAPEHEVRGRDGQSPSRDVARYPETNAVPARRSWFRGVALELELLVQRWETMAVDTMNDSVKRQIIMEQSPQQICT